MKKITSILFLSALLFSLAGCAMALPEQQAPAAQTSAETPQPQETPSETAAPAEPEEAPSAAPMQDGFRYDSVIMLEGMEETVGYEHVRNEALGFEMDFEYESFTRVSGEGSERFVSVWEDPADPWVYLEVKAETQDAETVAAAITGQLSAEYSVITENIALDRAGSCIRLDASATPDGLHTTDRIQSVYIIPAPNGCLVATAHYTLESAEGFGSRFRQMMNTFALL